MSQLLTPSDLKNESIEEEMERKGTPQIPDWLNVKKQVSHLSICQSRGKKGKERARADILITL
jgi:hypothetical protein